MQDVLISRRRLLRGALTASVAVAGWQSFAGLGELRVASAEDLTTIGADQALKELLDGNRRYLDGVSSGMHRTVERRIEVASGQAPIATILSCADSRVPPEL